MARWRGSSSSDGSQSARAGVLRPLKVHYCWRWGRVVGEQSQPLCRRQSQTLWSGGANHHIRVRWMNGKTHNNLSELNNCVEGKTLPPPSGWRPEALCLLAASASNKKVWLWAAKCYWSSTVKVSCFRHRGHFSLTLTPVGRRSKWMSSRVLCYS